MTCESMRLAGSPPPPRRKLARPAVDSRRPSGEHDRAAAPPRGPTPWTRRMNRDPLPTLSDLEVLLFDAADSQQAPHVRLVCPGVLLAGRTSTSHLVLPKEDVKASKMHFQ